MILCAGEALIDMLPRRMGAGEAAFAPHAGGAVLNTARGLGRLGAPVGLFTGLSSDLFGDVLRAAMADSEVADLSAVSDRPTTLAFVTLTDGQARYAFYDEGTAGRMLTEADLPDLTPEALFVGGISLAVEPCARAYEALVGCMGPDVVVAVDPNVRPGFVSDEAAFRARIARILARADIVKLSDEDARWLMGDRPLDAIAAELVAGGAALVCITEGARGVTGHTARGATVVPAVPTQVVDTVGAGDTFTAGLLAHLHGAGALTPEGLRGVCEDALTAALSYGARAAAHVVGRAGADAPWAADLG
ncbi:MAG: carbohydrate kinase family protein [Paracoccaceae bacterium]